MSEKQNTKESTHTAESDLKNTQTQKENRMGTEPIGKLLISMSTPIIISMFIQAMYNIIDSIFVAKYSSEALAAVSLAFPVQALMISVGSGTGIGINAFLSRSLGEGRKDEARSAALNGVFLAFLSFAAFALFGLFASGSFFTSQTDNPVTAKFGADYLYIVCIFSAGIMFEITYERILQATGNSFYSMITQSIGAVINIILDPILIFGLFGMPKLGISGAAIATVIGQSAAALLALYFNIYKNKEFSISIKGFKPSLKTIAVIYSVGVPSIIMQSITSVMVYFLNKILISFSEAAVTVLGVYFKTNSFIIYPVFGLTNGMIPIVAYNYGAKRKSRIKKTIIYSAVASTVIMLIGLAIFQIFPQKLMGLFNASGILLTLGVRALRIISLCFIFAGFNIVLSSMYQALGNGLYSLYLSLLRQIAIILPVAYLLSKHFGLEYTWYCFPIAEIAALAFNLFLLKKISLKLPK
ncbi:hypothetical protein HMPREF9333_01442 [Johnsonella ignava ATCC 51276]|jgi:MATE efflux family protein|uniref:Probable multidrug resistance protein NorM n=1 Tax=Johnsonella ignava ATCC 51276 TaxID=679200 RepID=G5GIQ2_9FIRM|nr:MATE family efflux transporter [Johnsonella ignava]EHI55306.1 hypothetical protein HMPREF9333_01442 [Johnsonella ignava ATCC 51276]